MSDDLGVLIDSNTVAQQPKTADEVKDLNKAQEVEESNTPEEVKSSNAEEKSDILKEAIETTIGDGK